jgi:hypothetical protein
MNDERESLDQNKFAERTIKRLNSVLNCLIRASTGTWSCLSRDLIK